MPKSRGRKPRKPTRAAQRSGDPHRRAAGRSSYLVGLAKQRLGGVLVPEVAGDDLTLTRLLPVLLDAVATNAALPAARCVDATQTLRYAFAEPGIASELRAVEMNVHDASTGTTFVHGTHEPSWEGNLLDGHCILLLPGRWHFIDATVEQYSEVARLRRGPVVGRQANSITSNDALAGELASQGILPGGSQLVVKRGDLQIAYTLSPDQATQMILGAPCVAGTRATHRAAGVNLAPWALWVILRIYGPEQISQIPYPRVVALLRALAGAHEDVDSAGNWRFRLAGTDTLVRLDELALPAGVPPSAPYTQPSHPFITAEHGAAAGSVRPSRALTDRVTGEDLRSGLNRDGLILRLARPGDAPAIAPLVALAGDGTELEPEVSDALSAGTLGMHLLTMLADGPDVLLEPLAAAATGAADPNEIAMGLTAFLVAQRPGHGIVGALQALPPSAVLYHAFQAGLPLMEALLGLSKVVKVRAIAVDEPFRRARIATRLIRLCTDLYFQLDYLVAYGAFDDRHPGLPELYTRCGYQTLAVGEPLQLELLSRPLGLHAGPHERFFVQYR
ncbi:MAG: hypothetical protein ACYCPF_03590 [Streptosporangiaceae bacterium]